MSKITTYFGFKNEKLVSVLQTVKGDVKEAVNCTYFISNPQEVKKQIQNWKKTEKEKNLSELLGTKHTHQPVWIPNALYDLLELQAKTKGTSVDREATKRLEINIDVLEHQFKQKYR